MSLLTIIIIWLFVIIFMLIINKKIGDKNKEFENNMRKSFENDDNKEEVLM